MRLLFSLLEEGLGGGQLDILGLRGYALRPCAKRISRSALKTASVDKATLHDFIIEPCEASASEYVAVCRKAGSP
jgi:hypothetical protein